MRVLVVSSTPWNTNNSFGNSYQNIFADMDELKIANVYCMEGKVNSSTVACAFQISPAMLVKNLRNKNYPAGKERKVNVEKSKTEKVEINHGVVKDSTLAFMKKHRYQIFFWMRDMIWKIGRWDSKELHQFVESFAPDIMFCPIYRNGYMNRIVLSIQKQCGRPLLGYISDDNYTLKQPMKSPFQWIDFLIKRRWVKKVIDACSILYVISDIQKKEYDKIFFKDSRILTKGINTANDVPEYEISKAPYRLFFAGNIGSGRWKSLALIGKEIQHINESGHSMEMVIYTPTPLTRKMKKVLNIPGAVRTEGPIPYEEVVKKQAKADILVHVETTQWPDIWNAHQGFSTKIVDYMATGRPILAYGSLMQASIDHLKKNNAAMVVTSRNELAEMLHRIAGDPSILSYYAQQAWLCGKRKHDITKFQAMLRKDFAEVQKSDCCTNQ